MQRFFDYFLSGYSGEKLEIRKKVRILLITNLVLAAFAVILGTTMFITGAIVVGILLVVFFAFCDVTMILIRFNKYKIAVNIFLSVLFTIMFLAIKFDQYVGSYETYVFATLGLFLLTTTILVGYHRFQPIIVTVLNVAAILAIYFLDSYVQQNYTILTIDIQSIATSLVMVIVGGIFGAITLSLQKELVREAEERAIINKLRFEKVDLVLKNAREKTLENSRILSETSESTIKMIHEFSSHLGEMTSGIEQLYASVHSSSEANSNVVRSSGIVKETVGKYSELVGHVSSSIEEIVTAIRSLAENAKAKRSSINNLVDSAHEGEQKIGKGVESIKGISQSTAGMLGIADMITDVASRTNMLALNASIEASHAGESGKGFAVVAGEIRKLAEETTRNSKSITENLKKNIEEIKTTVEISSGTGESFQKINTEIKGVIILIEEVIVGVEQMSVNAGDILTAVTEIMQSSVGVDQAMEESQSMIAVSNEGIGKVNQLSDEIVGLISNIGESFGSMMSEAENVNNFVASNMDMLNGLYTEIRQIGESEHINGV
jgi:methyl-accepting chemotaxis protein